MGAVIDVNAFGASLTGVGSLQATVAATGDTLVVRNFNPGTRAFLCDLANKHATAGIVRVRSPYLADDVNALRFRTLASDPSGLMPDEVNQPLHAQDTLIVESTGGAGAEQCAGILTNWYENPGVPGRCISYQEANTRVAAVMCTEVPVTTGAAGQWGTALLSTGSGILKANQDYAVLGFVLDVACAAVGILGLDTGNMRAGMPGSTDRFRTREHFLLMSRRYELDFVPVVNAANAGGTQISAIDNTAALAVNVGVVLGLLA